MIERTCPECGQPFVRTANRQKYCSKTCYARRNNRLGHERHGDKHREQSRAYYQANREVLRQKGLVWFEENRDAANASRRANHASNRERDNNRSRKYHAEHRDAANANRRKWHAAHREEANEKRKGHYQAAVLADPSLPQRMSAAQRSRIRQSQPWLILLASAAGRAAKKKVPFALTREWAAAKWTGRCELTGIVFDMDLTGKPGGRSYSPSIDRIIPSLGYVPENCRFILYGLNRFKGEMSDEEMITMARLLLTAPQQIS